jgi:hypothetical protein
MSTLQFQIFASEDRKCTSDFLQDISSTAVSRSASTSLQLWTISSLHKTLFRPKNRAGKTDEASPLNDANREDIEPSVCARGLADILDIVDMDLRIPCCMENLCMRDLGMFQAGRDLEERCQCILVIDQRELDGFGCYHISKSAR